MKVLDNGHKYEVVNFNKEGEALGSQQISFVKDRCINGDGYEGTNCQELLRVLINRVQFLESQLHSDVNETIIKHLRASIVLFEQRHLQRLLEKDFPIEDIQTFEEGHFTLIK